MARPQIEGRIEFTPKGVVAYKVLGVAAAKEVNADLDDSVVQLLMSYALKHVFDRDKRYDASRSPAERIEPLAYELLRRVRYQEALPEPAGGLNRPDGHVGRVYYAANDTYSSTYHLDGRYAGDIVERHDGSLEIHVDRGWKLLGPGQSNVTTHEIVIDEGITDYTVAEERLAAECRAARADQSLIWRYEFTPENIEKSKAKGWWKDAKNIEFTAAPTAKLRGLIDLDIEPPRFDRSQRC